APAERCALMDDTEERLDALWANFRLPVPVATPGNHKSGSDGPSASDARDDWTLRALDLLRLLHTMNEQHDNPQARSPRLSGYTPPRERVMESQMSCAQSLLSKVEGTFPSFAEDEQVYHQNCQVLLQKLRSDTGETIAKFQRWLDRRSEQQPGPKERDLLYDIFLAPDDPAPQDETEEVLEEFALEELDDFGDEGGDGIGNTANTQQASNVRRQEPQRQRDQTGALDPVEFQKQQQQLLEEELASMASRLKSSTLAMNSTLKTQTRDLDDMEQLAQTNLDQVTDTAKKVENRLARNKGWKKRLATWSTIAIVIGTWVLCFMIMRTVPKRRVGKMRWFKEGGAAHSLWKKGKDIASRMNRPLWEKEETYEEKWQREYFEEREEMRREKEQREQMQRQAQQECEILADGTQVCSDAQDSAGRRTVKAHELPAERRQRRIEENMANAPAVEAVESVEEEGEEPASSEDESQDDPMGCVPPTKEMHVHQSAMDELAKALNNVEKGLSQLPEDSPQWKNMSRNKEKLQAQSKKHYSALELEKNQARGAYWVDRKVREKARDLHRALGSIPFCKEGHVPKEESEAGEDVKARREAEEERKTKFMDEVRIAKEAQARADAEMKRRQDGGERGENEQARAKVEVMNSVTSEPKPEPKLFDFQAVEKQKWMEAQAAADAERQVKMLHDDMERIKKEIERRKEEEKIQAEKEREERRNRVNLAGVEGDKEEALRRAAEREEADRLEHERFAATAEEKAKARIIRETVARAEAGAREAMEQAKDVATPVALPSDIRNAAGRSQNDMLAHYISASPHMIDASDRSGWRPIHEAARAGNLAGVQLLVSAGVDLSSRTGRAGNGGTALWWAVQRFGEDHDIVRLLRHHGAQEAGPQS
ncbi:hypothetical protein ACHAXT_010333, partial [Thalassiosira profunda]